MAEENENIKFVDAESYHGIAKDKITFKEITLQHYKRIANFQCTEFRGGYWEKKILKGGMVEHHYIPDTRDVYNGGVDYLNDLLLPYFDKEMLAADKKVTDSLSEVWGTFVKAKKDNPNNYGSHYQQYLNAKLKLKRELFQELSKLLFRLKYLEGKTFEGEE